MSGSFRFGVETGKVLVTEGRDPFAANNKIVATNPINIELSPFPNLKITNVAGPTTSVFSEQNTTVSWTVANLGTADTNAPVWYDAVWLSTDDVLSEDDVFLGQKANAAYLKPGDSYVNELSVKIPRGTDGAGYRFIVKTDSGRGDNASTQANRYAVYEYDKEGDNLGISAATRVELAPPPDLKVTSVLAPVRTFAGQQMKLDWQVANVSLDGGRIPTDVSSWGDALYLSLDNQLDASDVLLKSVYQSASATNNGAYTNSQLVEIPDDIQGNYYFIAKTNATNPQFELALSQNNWQP
jgi:hypothetical protein